ncbi:hypothetical protein [Heyndrickxia coagulans]|uniref:hypothetical protein n=1 Tax=Heyndrickxia coagulans TaxID=1398 RepID=UPI0035A3A56C
MLCGYISICVGLVELLLLNGSFIFNSMIFISFPCEFVGSLFGVIAVFKKESRSYGIWGILLNVFIFVFVVVVSILSLSINYHP